MEKWMGYKVYKVYKVARIVIFIHSEAPFRGLGARWMSGWMEEWMGYMVYKVYNGRELSILFISILCKPILGQVKPPPPCGHPLQRGIIPMTLSSSIGINHSKSLKFLWNI